MINEPWYGKTKETYGIHEQKTFESSGQRPDEATTKTQYFCIDVRIFALHKILKSEVSADLYNICGNQTPNTHAFYWSNIFYIGNLINVFWATLSERKHKELVIKLNLRKKIHTDMLTCISIQNLAFEGSLFNFQFQVSASLANRLAHT